MACTEIYYHYLTSLLLLICANGESIPITNAGFEEDDATLVTNSNSNHDGNVEELIGWNIYDPLGVNRYDSPGVSNPGACDTCASNQGVSFNDPIYGDSTPEGNACLYLWAGSYNAGAFGVEQELLSTFEPLTSYILSVKVGNQGRNCWIQWNGRDVDWCDGCNGFSGYVVQLLADNIIVAQDDNSMFIADRKWQIITVNYTTSSADIAIGKTLKIRLLQKNDASATSHCLMFDDVVLTANTAIASTYIPTTAEPVISSAAATTTETATTTSTSTASSSTTSSYTTVSSTTSTLSSTASSISFATESISTLSSLLRTSNEPSSYPLSSTLSAVNTPPVAHVNTILPTDITRNAITSFDSLTRNPIDQTIFVKKLDILHMILMVSLLVICFAFIVFIRYHFAFKHKHEDGLKHKHEESVGNERTPSDMKRHNKHSSRASDFMMSNDVNVMMNIMNPTAGNATQPIHNVELVMKGSARITRGQRAANVVPDVQENGEESYAVDFSRVLSNDLWGTPGEETIVPGLIPPTPPQQTTTILIPPPPPVQATNVFEPGGEIN